MKYDCYIGIDYGTSTCKLAYVIPPYANRKASVESFAFPVKGVNTSQRFPSCVVFEKKRGRQRTEIGFRAMKLIEDESTFKQDQLQLVFSPKMDLGKGIVYPFAPFEHSEPPDLCALALKEMLDEFERTMGFRKKDCKVLVSVPSSFGFDQRQELLGAISAAGVDSDGQSLIDEPNAAFLGLLDHSQFNTVLRRSEGGRIMLIDFGAGTCDISILDVEEDRTNEPYGMNVTNLAISDYAELGGNDIDRAIARYAAAKVLENQSAELSKPEIDREEAEESIAVKLAVRTRTTKEDIITSLSRRKIRAAKPSKFRIDIPKMAFPWFSLKAQNISYGEQELVNVIDRLLGKWGEGPRRTLADLIENVLQKAGLKDRNVNAIVLAGGSSKIFGVEDYKRFLLGLFPHLTDQHIVTTHDADLLISRGAALEAYNSYHLGKPLIRPICPSHVGVLTAEKKNEVLIPSGTALPYPNQEDKRHERVLYVPSPKPDAIRIPMSVSRFGEWIPVESWVVDLPEDFEANEPLVFSAKMDLEKVLQIEFRSATRPGLVFKKQTEKWLHGKEPTLREARIIKMRTELKARAKMRIDVYFDQIFSLVNEEYKAGYYDLVKDRCHYLLTRPDLNDTRKAKLWNLIGLARDQLGGSRGLSAYKEAARLDPDGSWVYHYNVGVTHLWCTHRFDEAEKALQAAARLGPHDMKAHHHYGEALSKNGKSVESRACFSRAFDLAKSAYEAKPTDPEARMYFRYACDMLGLEYPESLRGTLLDPEPQDCDNVRPSLRDQGDIVRSERNEE